MAPFLFLQSSWETYKYMSQDWKSCSKSHLIDTINKETCFGVFRHSNRCLFNKRFSKEEIIKIYSVWQSSFTTLVNLKMLPYKMFIELKSCSYLCCLPQLIKYLIFLMPYFLNPMSLCVCTLHHHHSAKVMICLPLKDEPQHSHQVNRKILIF